MIWLRQKSFILLLHKLYFCRVQRCILRQALIVYRLIDMALIGIFSLIPSYFKIEVFEKCCSWATLCSGYKYDYRQFHRAISQIMSQRVRMTCLWQTSSYLWKLYNPIKIIVIMKIMRKWCKYFLVLFFLNYANWLAVIFAECSIYIVGHMSIYFLRYSQTQNVT